MRIKEHLEYYLFNGDEPDIQAIADELYNNEDNFNNCDTTSGQRVYSYEQIAEMVARQYMEISARSERK